MEWRGAAWCGVAGYGPAMVADGSTEGISLPCRPQGGFGGAWFGQAR